MYFGRFYEFKERLKKYFNSMRAVAPKHHVDIGDLIRLFEKVSIRSYGHATASITTVVSRTLRLIESS